MKIIIKGGRVVDPGQKLDEPLDLLIEEGRIVDLVKPGQDQGFAQDAETVDAENLFVVPGLIDMHVHLREPGHEYKETIASGTAAAAAGGFTAVAAMPNTTPVNDSRAVTEFILAQAKDAASSRVYPVAAMTVGSKGKELTEYFELAEAGAVGVSDDGRPCEDSALMRRILEYAPIFGLLPISHSEDLGLSAGGVMNEGVTSTRSGLPGIPVQAEEVAVFRDLELARLAGSPIHIAHVSTAGSISLIKKAKAAGIKATAETAPHYFTLTEEAVIPYRTEAKMNPPLRTADDVEAIKAGLADGTIDAIATDHAPHSSLEKDVEFDQAAFGIIGLETALALTLGLVEQKILTLPEAISALSLNPARILNVEGGSLMKGTRADITLIDTRQKWTVDLNEFQSKSRNSPFAGHELTGRAAYTLVDGRIIFRRP